MLNATLFQNSEIRNPHSAIFPKTNQLADWITWLEDAPKCIDLGLERVQKVGHAMGLIPLPCPVIIVGGTNGKGSCVTFIENILRAEGLRVGAYTSPHLLHFNERIRLESQDISDAMLCEALQAVHEASLHQPLTYFEFTTLAAFYCFKQAHLDWAVLEVGMGGRLDAVNVQDPVVSVITTIDLDHQEWLGSTREAIAVEKAGIFRSQRPAICGDPCPPVTLMDYVALHEIPCDVAGDAFHYQVTDQNWSWQGAGVCYQDLPKPTLPIPNAATALMALHRLPLTISRMAIEKGLAAAKLPGRFQSLKTLPNCVVDVAHNPESVRYLAKQIIQEKWSGPIHAVMGMLKTKDIRESVKPMLKLVDVWHVGTLATELTAQSEHLSKILQEEGAHQVYTYSSIDAAFREASRVGKHIVVFGSFYTVAEVLWKHTSNKDWLAA